MEMLNLYLYDLGQTFFKELPFNLAYFICALVLIYLAKLARDLTTRGVDDDSQITLHDNKAFGLYTAGYYAGVGLSFVGVFLGEGGEFLQNLIEIFQYGLTGIVFLGVSYVISDKIYLSRVKIMDSLTTGNSAVALFLAGRFIFAGLSILSAIHGDGIWFISFVYYLLGEAGCYIGFKVYTMVTPYDDIRALENGNQAVGLVSGGVLVSMGLLMLNALWGDFLGYDIMLVNFSIWFFGGLALLLVFRTLGSRLLFPKSSLVKEIYDDNNIGAAAIMAVAYIIIATVIILSF